MADLDFKQIGLKIRERRMSQKLTQELVANILDVNPSHVSNIECGRANPSLTVLVKLANILHCSVDYFINHEYTYKNSGKTTDSIDQQLMEKLKYTDSETKIKLLKIVDFI